MKDLGQTNLGATDSNDGSELSSARSGSNLADDAGDSSGAAELVYPNPTVRARITTRLFRHLRDRVASARTPDVLIGKAGDTYMERWWVIPRNPIFNIYLHHFLRSDDDRALHDHPWWNASVLLNGRYTEHTISAGGVNRRVEYAAGAIKLRNAKYAHRVELTDGPCWSLFITGPRLREWGFHCPHGWRHWKQFVDGTNSGHIGRGCD